MRKLLRQIKRELKTAKHCAVYEEELSRVWPDGNQREPKVALFAEDNGLRLRFYRDGLCAIFDKEPRAHTQRERGLNGAPGPGAPSRRDAAPEKNPAG
jgi:hypothetical protein